MPASRERITSTALLMMMRSIVLSVLVVGLSSCTAFKGGSPADKSSQAVLQVDNRGFIDMTVYALRSSQRLRLGTAPGNQKTNLDIPPGIVTGLTSLRFVADPIGGTRASVSEEITVAPGDTVGLLIPPI